MPSSASTGIVLGGVTLVGGILIGKIAVDAVQGKVDHHPGTPSPMDQSVRFVASLLGITVTLLQLPAAWDAAQELINGAQRTP